MDDEATTPSQAGANAPGDDNVPTPAPDADATPDAATDAATDSVPDSAPDATLEDGQIQDKAPRDARALASVVVLIVIVLLVLFLLRDCRGGDNGLGDSGGKSIERVRGAQPVTGAVSVWISSDTTIEQAARGAGVRTIDFVSLGSGQYIVQVAEGSEVRSAEAIATQPGVYDAGLVYEASD